MNDQAASVQPASSPPPASGRSAPVAPLWHLGWAVGALTAAAGLLAALGALPVPIAMALGLSALPGLVGYFWQPARGQQLVLIGLWTVAMVAAATVSGGATGPLAAWCFAPLLVGALIGAPAEGAVLAAVAVAVLVLLELAGTPPAPPAGPFGVGLAAAGLLLLGGGVAGALGVLVRRAQEQQADAEADHAWMSGVMAELPHLALALDPQGRPEAVFGASLPGLEIDALRGGLSGAVAEADRAAVRAALWKAFDQGAGEAVFSPAAAPDRRMVLSLHRRDDDGLMALIRETEATEAARQQPAPTPPPAPADKDKDEAAKALWREQVARTVAETRARAALHKLKMTEQARDQALNALAAAQAAHAAAEAAREGAEANATAKSRFLANMSHELRTPLNAIMGFSDIMRQRMFGDLTPKYGEYVELIHESGRHLTDLINDVLDMSKIEAERYTLDPDLFDAREPVSGALRLMRLQADAAGVVLRGVLPQAPLMVDADRRALKQIVLNLVSNALKFTPAGGSITVTTQAVGDALELVVADTGVGIAKEDLQRLGKPYEQAGDAEHKAQGTGLGLSLVRAFARLHGGEMTIESALGDGAAVTVRLPVLHKDEVAAPAEPQAEEPPPAASEAKAPEPESEPEASAAPSEPRLVPVGNGGAPAAVIGVSDAQPAPTDPETPAARSATDQAPTAQAYVPQRSADIIPLNLLR